MQSTFLCILIRLQVMGEAQLVVVVDQPRGWWFVFLALLSVAQGHQIKGHWINKQVIQSWNSKAIGIPWLNIIRWHWICQTTADVWAQSASFLSPTRSLRASRLIRRDERTLRLTWLRVSECSSSHVSPNCKLPGVARPCLKAIAADWSLPCRVVRTDRGGSSQSSRQSVQSSQLMKLKKAHFQSRVSSCARGFKFKFQFKVSSQG